MVIQSLAAGGWSSPLHSFNSRRPITALPEAGPEAEAPDQARQMNWRTRLVLFSTQTEQPYDVRARRGEGAGREERACRSSKTRMVLSGLPGFLEQDRPK